VAFLTTAVTIPASAQVWDFTGNGQLNGAYVFREAIYIANASGTITRAIVDYGTITFNGNGGYALSANEIDSSAVASSYTQNGTYSISASGFGFMTHPYDPAQGLIYGSVSNGVFIGSATESGINDMMIAVKSSSATNATFTGNYTMDYINFPSPLQALAYDSTALLSPGGNGTIGTVQVKTFQGASDSQPVLQTANGVSYSFTNGIGTLKFPTVQNLAIQGDKRMFISPDGNLIFGGSDSTFDFFVGVRRATGTQPPLEGLFYTAALENLPYGFDSFYGAFTANSSVLLEHQRFLETDFGTPQDYTGVSVLPVPASTDYSDYLTAVDYTISQDGKIRIGIGKTPYIGLRIALHGPTYSGAPGSAPYIFPTGVVNSASFAPFTSGVAPGELLTIFGANLAGSTVAMQGGIPFPSKLGDVRVLMNNRPAAIYYVSPTQISAIVPYNTTEKVVQIQVETGGVTSNTVTALQRGTNPGVFSQLQSGEGLAIAAHANGALITEANPARPGEVIVVVLTGLGAVFPSIQDGGLGSVTAGNLNVTPPGTIAAKVDNLLADIAYSGLAPGLAGLYQVNLTVPADSSSGNVELKIYTPDGFTSQVALAVGNAQASDATSRKAQERPFVRHR
jgi:uncharacterized protein (TIGR03437 family)